MSRIKPETTPINDRIKIILEDQVNRYQQNPNLPVHEWLKQATTELSRLFQDEFTYRRHR